MNKTTVGEFSEQISKEYGPDTADAFKKKFPSEKAEITYKEGFDELDRVLLGNKKPQFPSFGPTDSRSLCCELVFKY